MESQLFNVKLTKCTRARIGRPADSSVQCHRSRGEQTEFVGALEGLSPILLEFTNAHLQSGNRHLMRCCLNSWHCRVIGIYTLFCIYL